MIKINYLFAALFSLLFIACQPEETVSQENDQTVQTEQSSAVSITNSEWKASIEEYPGVILDVRTENEYLQGHIEGSKLVDITSSEFMVEIEALSLDKTQPVYLYCRSGSRSKKAMALLKDQGFTKIYELDDGIMGWQEEGYEITK